ncbi:MAG: hypothetical protein ACI4ES_10255 [Roseburia sp.]
MITALWSKVIHNWFVKCFFAGIVALGILSLFSVFYYNPPIHVNCESGATDYTREANVFWARGTEGFAKGTTDENGYNNAYEEEDEIDILLMGSSQTEGLYVDEKENVGYLLNEMFAESGDEEYVYNIGMSSHTFLRNVSNLEYALETYHPNAYVALEADFVNFTIEEIDAALQDQMAPLETYQDGFLYEIQRIPYMKLLYQQYKDYQGGGIVVEDVVAVEQTQDSGYNVEKVMELLAYIKSEADAYGVTAIIYYDPYLILEEDGSIATSANPEKVSCFSQLCEENGILFIDMTEAFVKEYEENHRIVSGFSNTAECYGHLNRYGHKLIAEAIYQEIKKGQ